MCYHAPMSNVLTAEHRLNPRQMTFVGYIAAGESAVNAYKLAGYAGEAHTLYGSASRLLTKPHIKAELARQVEAGRRATGLTLETLVSELLENGKIARELKQISASTQAYIAAGTALGIYVPKSESKSYSYSADVTRVLEGMTREELLGIAMSRREKPLELPEANKPPI